MIGSNALCYSASIEELAEYLAKCQGGAPLGMFDTLSTKKKLADLYEEVSHKEIILSQHPEHGWAVRSAVSIKALIYNPVLGQFLWEESRTHQDGETISSHELTTALGRIWSFSETQRREGRIACLTRGWKEEILASVGSTEPLVNITLFETPPPELLRPSSVYYGVMSDIRPIIYRAETRLDLSTIPPTIRDGNVIINRKILPQYDIEPLITSL